MTTEILTWLPEIALPPAWRRKADDAMGMARRGLIKLIGEFGDPEDAPRRNRVDMGALRWARTQLRRLHDIVRCTLMLFAIYLEPSPVKMHSAKAKERTPQKPVTQDAKTWRVRLRLLQNLDGPKGAARPPHLAHAPRNDLLSLARGMEALRRVLANPARHAKRLARALRTSMIMARFPALKRTPPEGRDAYFADRRDMRHTTAWALDMFYRPNRYRDDTS